MRKFFCVLFGIALQIAILQAMPIQNPADKPKDTPIQINSDGKTYCYAPVFTKGEGYIYIDYCNSSYVKPARYDVFQRIGFNVNGVWVCATAPSSVTGIGGKSNESWDYVILRPCVLNDPNQRWVVKNNAFYSADGKFRITHYKWYATISKNLSGFYQHTINGSMKSWIDTIAQPMNLSLQTFLGWVYIGRGVWGVYYMRNNASYTGPGAQLNLYYNPENGHIAQYYPESGELYCMTSKANKSQDWNWVKWSSCNDSIPAQKDATSWELFLPNGNQGMFRDYNGYFLTVTQYGPNWGVPYTIKPTYVDKTNSPKSLFIYSPDLYNWDRFVDGNVGDNLHTCPATGSKPKIRKVRSLPPTFELTEAWMRRFYQISTSTVLGSRDAIGLCGICLLHTYQILAELQEYALTGPLQSGGYFFDTQPEQSPFISFQNRYPELARRLLDVMNFYDLPMQAGETNVTRYRRIHQAIAVSMLPQYNWNFSDTATNEDEVRSLISNALRAPVGTLWMFNVVRINPNGTQSGHAEPLLRTRDGLVAIRTNNNVLDFNAYASLLAPMTTPEQFIDRITINRTRTIGLFTLYEVTNYYENPFEVSISQNNCAGEGEDRRGNLFFPRSGLINQCASGRCAIQ